MKKKPVPIFSIITAATALITFTGQYCVANEPESTRLSNETFYDGLISLHLNDLLEYHLAKHPPQTQSTLLHVLRQEQLACWDDETADTVTRHQALTKANDLLGQLISEYGENEETIDWRLALAKSLIYEQAEPYYGGILLRGGTAADRRALSQLMTRAVDTLTRLQEHLDKEYARLDEVSLGEYESLERKGYVSKIETAMPQAEYMLLWAGFYRTLALSPDDAARNIRFKETLDALNESGWLTQDHSLTRVQAQSLLLAGMIYRQLGEVASAERHLRHAAEIADSLPNPQEKRNLQWLVLLASVERIRSLRDSDQHQLARKSLSDLRQKLVDDRALNFGNKLLLAMLEGSIEQTAAETGGFQPSITEKAAQPLMRLAKEQPAYRDEIYASLYVQLRHTSQPEKLHPFQQCALIAGHIAEAGRLRHGLSGTNESVDKQEQPQAEAKAIALLDEAIRLAQCATSKPEATLDDQLRAELLFNLGVAYYQRGRLANAAKSFNDVATNYPRFAQGISAANYAVEISAKLSDDSTLRNKPEIQQLLLQTLQTLVDKYPNSESAQYWRFFLGQALEDTGHLREASEVYERVLEDHPHYMVALFRVGKCMANEVIKSAKNKETQPNELRRIANTAHHKIEQFTEYARAKLPLSENEEEKQRTLRMLAESDTLLAEMNITEGIDRPARALELLEDFERKHPNEDNLLGRVLRVRIIAYETTGQLDQAKEAVPRFIAQAPQKAAETLQSLFDATWEDIKAYRELGETNAAAGKSARLKAKSALIFADHLYEWALKRNTPNTIHSLNVLRLQLAEAQLENGNHQDALKLFQEATAVDSENYDDHKAHNPRIVLGMAHTLLSLSRYDEALPLFNQIYLEAAPESATRFEALLGDLNCRVAMNEDRTVLIEVIRQHRFLNAEMGGNNLKNRFDDLQKRLETRRN